FSSTLDLEINAAVQRLALAVHGRKLPWIRDVVPALGGLALHFDPDAPQVPGPAIEAAANLVMDCLKSLPPPGEEPARVVEVPVCYAPEVAPDIEEVAKRTRLSVAQVAERHAAAEYRVLMIG